MDVPDFQTQDELRITPSRNELASSAKEIQQLTNRSKRGVPKSVKKATKRPLKKKRKVIDTLGDCGVGSDDVPNISSVKYTEGPESSAEQDDDEVDEDEVYCICRKPDTGKWMIGCDGCDDWFHGQCVNIIEEDGSLLDKYYCPRCQESGHGTTTWKRKCRLPGCRIAAQTARRPPSKYCSQQHGIEFFKLKCNISEVSCRDLATIVSTITASTSFRQLGDRVPTPTTDRGMDYSDDISRELHIIRAERHELTQRQATLATRSFYITLTRERHKRVAEEVRNEPDYTPKTGKDICGFDMRLAKEEEDFEDWCASTDAKSIFENGKIDGRENMCLKKKCERHRHWLRVVLEDVEHGNRLIQESLVKLDADEARIRERRKERALESANKSIASLSD